MEKQEEIVGYITLGPKENYHGAIAIFYEPNEVQLHNIQELFGWDYVSRKEFDEQWKAKQESR